MADKNSSNIFEFPELSEYSYFDPGLHIYGKFENSSGVAKPRIAGKSSSKTKSVNKAGQVEKKIKQNEQIKILRLLKKLLPKKRLKKLSDRKPKDLFQKFLLKAFPLQSLFLKNRRIKKILILDFIPSVHV